MVLEGRESDEELEGEIAEDEIRRAIERLKKAKLLKCMAYREKCGLLEVTQQ